MRSRIGNRRRDHLTVVNRLRRPRADRRRDCGRERSGRLGLAEVLAWASSGWMPPHVSHTFALDQVKEAMLAKRRGEDGRLRAPPKR